MCIKTGIKIRVTPEQSKKIQEICFKNGISWGFTSNKIVFTDEPFLFINKDATLDFTDKDSELFFNTDSMEEVSAEFFIRTNGTCIESESTTESKPSEELQPKTLSEYLKENNAYESFVENYVEYFFRKHTKL